MQIVDPPHGLGIADFVQIPLGGCQVGMPQQSLVCFWAVRELGLVGTAVGRQMGLVQSAVSKAVERGAELAATHDFRIED